ncbi:uncharacterized protein LOC130761262 [Actinidia eriantha]|uniref:uncharacterized protein LOC130761262 n=1 Tax=Actinidia eriantha TaxID=165200 RepID=UPI0025886781|nr:uncharacterized protein LOC130761262 [Actinidia eriantha]
MVASLLLPSPSSNRMGKVCLHMHSNQLQKSIMCLSVHIQNKGSNSKLYMIPGGAISCRRVFRPLTVVGSLELDGTHLGNQSSSSVWGRNNLQGSTKLLDNSRDTLEEPSDFERQLGELFDKVKTMIKMGNKKDAINLLQANYEAVKEQLDAGARGIEEAAMLDIIALGYMAIGKLKRVGSLLDLLNEVIDGLKDDEPLLDSILTHMGSMYSSLGKFEKSVLAYRRSLEISESEYGKSSTFLVVPLLGMAKVLGSMGRATQAVNVYRRVITILELSKGAESRDLVVPLLSLGNLLIKEGRAMDAESPFLRILNIYKKLYGENDGRVGMAMSSLARVQCAKGNADEAIQLYRDAIQILKDSKYMPLDDNIMERMRIELAQVLHIVGRGNEGRELLGECLFIAEKYKGKEHPSLVPHLVNLATSYSNSKNFVEAERLLRRSLQIMLKTVDSDDQSITFPMLNLAVTLHNLHQYAEAEELALEVLRIREKAFGKESIPVGEALDCLVSIQTKLEKDDTELLEHLKRVLAIQERKFGHESEEVMMTLEKVIFFLDKLGMRDEKFPLRRRLSLLRTKYENMVRY